MTVNVTRDIAYGDAALQKLDFYEPEKSNGAAILDIHGGGWFRGEKNKEGEMAERFAALGYTVAVPNYRLAPEAFFPAARDDVLAAFSWLREHTKGLQLGVFGSSAGGSLSVDVGLAEGVPTSFLVGHLRHSSVVRRSSSSRCPAGYENRFCENGKCEN